MVFEGPATKEWERGLRLGGGVEKGEDNRESTASRVVDVADTED